MEKITRTCLKCNMIINTRLLKWLYQLYTTYSTSVNEVKDTEITWANASQHHVLAELCLSATCQLHVFLQERSWQSVVLLSGNTSPYFAHCNEHLLPYDSRDILIMVKMITSLFYFLFFFHLSLKAPDGFCWVLKASGQRGMLI